MTNDIPTTEASSNHQDSQELQVPQAPQAPQYPQDPQDFRSRQDLLEQPGAQGPRDLHDTSLDQLAKPYQDNEVYLGESTLLRVVHNDHPPVGSYRSTKSHLRYPLPEVAAVPEWERQRKSRRLEALTAEGVLSSPDATVQNELFEAYFKWFHVCFPVVNKPATFRQSQAGELSPMLCNAMMFIGVIHSHPDELRKIGLGNREEARHLFYNRAKDLYDVDYESNSLVQLQTMFLLSFWRGGPLLQKDCRYWLGGAITLAQKKGMHRSFGNSDSMQARLRKRIWWSVYVRERQCAAALGLPNRIYDDDCDVDSLTVSDLDDSESLDAHTLLYSLEHVYYAIEMAKLTMFLGKIVHKEYMPNGDQSPLGRRQLKSELDNWHRQLPEVLGRGNDTGGLFVGMLHMAYNNILILLSRWAFIAGDQTGAEENSQTAYLAACRISRIAEDLLAENLIGHGQIHLITCLFNALCIHTVNLRRVEGTSRLVAEHRAKMCLYGLRELQKTWEVTNWVLQIFFQHLDRSMARRLQMIDQEEEDDTRSMAEKGPTISPPNHAPLAPVTGTNEPNETGVQIPVPPILESEFLKWGSMDDVGEFSLDALSNLDGITAVDLELLASCLT
jgi:hypothetical protein